MVAYELLIGPLTFVHLKMKGYVLYSFEKVAHFEILGILGVVIVEVILLANPEGLTKKTRRRNLKKSAFERTLTPPIVSIW